jgi:hypothetical protein
MVYSECLATRLNHWLRGHVSPRSELGRLRAAVAAAAAVGDYRQAAVLGREVILAPPCVFRE